MKKFTLLVIVIFCGSTIAQSQSFSYPHAIPTINKKQINDLGLQYQYSNNNNSVIVLDFEGLGNNDPINDYYNGLTSGMGYSGPNHGIEFISGTGLIDYEAGGTGNFANEPSPSTVMFFQNSNLAYMNVAAGFTTGFSFYFSSFISSGVVSVYDGLNGTGNLLATVNLPLNFNFNCTGDPDGWACNWDPIGVPITGTAKSVAFSGAMYLIAFDNVTIGSITPGTAGTTANGNNVTVCHLPPGNQNNPQTIHVSQNAVAAHLAHGDVLGTCGGSNKTGVQDAKEDSESRVFPNPFTDYAAISFNLARNANVEIDIYCLSGLKVNTIHSGNLSSGDHTFAWRGDNNKGSSVSKGMYILLINHDGIIEHHKLFYN